MRDRYDEYDEVAERIHALGMPIESYQAGTDKIAAILRDTFPSVQVEDERALAALESRIELWRRKYLPRLDGPNDREDLLYIIAMDAIEALRSRLAEPEPAQAVPSEEAERLLSWIDDRLEMADAEGITSFSRRALVAEARRTMPRLRAALARHPEEGR